MQAGPTPASEAPPSRPLRPSTSTPTPHRGKGQGQGDNVSGQWGRGRGKNMSETGFSLTPESSWQVPRPSFQTPAPHGRVWILAPSPGPPRARPLVLGPSRTLRGERPESGGLPDLQQFPPRLKSLMSSHHLGILLPHLAGQWCSSLPWAPTDLTGAPRNGWERRAQALSLSPVPVSMPRREPQL